MATFATPRLLTTDRCRFEWEKKLLNTWVLQLPVLKRPVIILAVSDGRKHQPTTTNFDIFIVLFLCLK